MAKDANIQPVILEIMQSSALGPMRSVRRLESSLLFRMCLRQESLNQ